MAKNSLPKKPLWMAHVLDLRGRVVRVLAVMLVLMVGLWLVKEPLLAWMVMPLQQAAGGVRVVASGVQDVFLVYVQLTTWGGIVLGVPYLLWEVGRFMWPGLYAHERRLLAGGLGLVAVLFYGGVLFAYAVVMPLVLGFFFSFVQGDVVEALPNIREYLGWLMKLCVGVGLAFNIPLVVLLLLKLGVVQRVVLVKYRRFAIVVAFIVAAVLTPPDPVSQLALAVPLVVLFEGALLLARGLKF